VSLFTGKCVGAPHGGQMMAHWQRTKKLYRPMVGFSMNMESSPVEGIDIGEYRLNDFGQWHWWETDAGRAYRKLFEEMAP
jgi:hypothetical protein